MTSETEKIVYQPSKTTHWRNLFENKSMLLGAHNLNPGEELVAKIASVHTNQEITGNKGVKEHVSVIKFENAPPMVLNVTNTRTIASLYGEYYDNWIGKSIQVYATEVKAFGNITMALRIREAIPDTGEDVSEYIDLLKRCQSMKELQDAYFSIPKHLKGSGSSTGKQLNQIKEEMKGKLDVRNDF